MAPYDAVIGIDEVGRGPLAGPLCVGACLLPRAFGARTLKRLRGVRDSKALSPEAREKWCLRIKREVKNGGLFVATSFVGERTIDRRGLSFALRSAIKLTLRKLDIPSSRVLVLLDGGLRAPESFPLQKTIIGGDESEPLIALASIVAKVRRDRFMVRLARRYPAYGFEKHKGYGTRAHYKALKRHGLSDVHRKSFLAGLGV